MTEPVGNKRPPVHSRFKTGQSGNPRGRPKGTLNLKTDLLDELAEVIVVTEGSNRRKMTKQRAFVKATMAKAIQGDGRAAATLIGLMARLLPPVDADSTEQTRTKDDDALIAAFLKRHGR